MLKKLGWSILILLSLLLLFVVAAVAPINDVSLNELDAVKATYASLDNINLHSSKGNGAINAGWSTVNITPKKPIDMAGYGPRGPYHAVLDSLSANVIVLENGTVKAAIISLDLLMFPSGVKQVIYSELEKHGFFQHLIFLSATHTHNGFGNWDQSIAGEFLFGKFDEKNVQYLTDQIVKGVLHASSSRVPVEIGFQKIDAHELVVNRLAGNQGTIDPYIRIISFKKENGNRALLISYSGHAVNLDADLWVLSRDYPGILVDDLMGDDSIEFAMFSAGMVGSHNINLDVEKGPQRTITTGNLLSSKIISGRDSVKYAHKEILGGADLEIQLPPSQLRIAKHLRIRDWLFRALVGPLHANVKVLEIGDILLIGMPCDYSGELAVNNLLDQFAEANGKKLFITSFNGNYVGYITEDSHYYTLDHDEVRVMNWVGPNKGIYFTEIIKKLIIASN